jgi:hypothetical protein
VLYIVLFLVLAALGLLVAALITASSLWAWVSIGLSVLAGLFLVLDYVRRRRGRARPPEVTAVHDAVAPDESEADTDAPAEQIAEPLPITEAGVQPAAVETGDPAEENTAPADAEVVAELETEVVVVDEYPRYHLPDCSWLVDRDTIPIVVKEARDLGFTPCARCTPDVKLAAAHRAGTKS